MVILNLTNSNIVTTPNTIANMSFKVSNALKYACVWPLNMKLNTAS